MGKKRSHPWTPSYGRTALAYDDLRDWIKALEKSGELNRIREEVSPELEITEITDRVSKLGREESRFFTARKCRSA